LSATARTGAARTQAQRRSRSRAALLESAARGLSRYGYGNLVLEQVARDAGYTRGALYHQFADKDELTLAALAWVLDTWSEEVGRAVERKSDPVAALLALARGHAVFCRRDIARFAFALRLEFAGQDHPIGLALDQAYEQIHDLCRELIEAARATAAIRDAAPSDVLAVAMVGALEGVVMAMAGREPEDEVYAERVVVGVLGLEQDDRAE
jgi:AcrR family transcriptional regulator